VIGRRTALALCGAAALASAGPAGATTVGVSFSLPILAQLTGLSDVTFPAISLTADSVVVQSDCAWTNSALRAYTVTASGSGTGAAFTLANPGGKTVPYSVGWAGTANAGSTTALLPATRSVQFTNVASSPTCTTGNATSSTLTITIRAADAQTMVGGTTYTGALTLMLTPS
jgi:hypothetical protein